MAKGDQLPLTDRPICYRVPLPVREGDDPIERGYREVYRTSGPKPYAVVCQAFVADEVGEAFARVLEDAEAGLRERIVALEAEVAAERKSAQYNARLASQYFRYIGERARDTSGADFRVALKERLRKGGFGLGKEQVELVIALIEKMESG